MLRSSTQCDTQFAQRPNDFFSLLFLSSIWPYLRICIFSKNLSRNESADRSLKANERKMWRKQVVAVLISIQMATSGVCAQCKHSLEQPNSRIY